MKKVLFLFVIFTLAHHSLLVAKQTSPPDDSVMIQTEQPPALSAIKNADLKKDLFELAGDAMRGRRAGTINELKAAAWVAEQAREAGLQPAGENGTYFQFFSLYRSTLNESSTVNINDKPASLWKDLFVASPVDADLDDSVTWLDALPDSTADLNGKVVAMNLMPPNRLPAENMSLRDFRYALSAIRQQGSTLQKSGASAIILVVDSTAANAVPYLSLIFQKGSYQLEASASSSNDDAIPVIIAGKKWEEDFHQKDANISAHLRVNNYTYPSANVIAKAPGTDAKLKDEYVLFSGHHDHEGVGMIPVKGDSIWNGADDNVSTSVALLAIGRAWVKVPGKRSALFVWHGAEERGLFGSRYFVQHPTVPKESITAVLNGDLIGRNAPDEAALLGAIPPHRNSKDLVDMAMSSNQLLTQFKVDTSWDAEDHPEHWYFRSDHLPYARAGIPAIFFTTLLHPDYHTPQDNPDRIDIEKLANMTKWMYATGWNVSQQEARPGLDAKEGNK